MAEWLKAIDCNSIEHYALRRFESYFFQNRLDSIMVKYIKLQILLYEFDSHSNL